MDIKYVKNPSGYCYKVKGNKKIRISKEEYTKKTKKTQGGNNVRIHPSNLPKSSHQTIKQCSSRCDSFPSLDKRILCVSKCQEESKKR